MAKSFTDWLKSEAGGNTSGVAGKAFVAMDVANLVTAENKLKAVRDLLKNILLMRPAFMLMGTAAFGGMSKMVKSLVSELGIFSDRLKKVKDEYAKVQEKMARGLAAPFEANEIANTTKMTKAMEAMVPVVNRLSKTYHAIYGGVSTFKAGLMEAIATSRVARGAIEAFGTTLAVIIPIISAVSVLKLGGWLRNLGTLMGTGATFASGFGKAISFLSFDLIKADKAARVAQVGFTGLKGAMRFAGVFAAAAVIGTVIMGLVGLYESVRAAKKEMAALAAENTKSNNAMNAQISAINTLEEKYTALAAALDAAAESRKAFQKAMEERSITGWITGTDRAKENLLNSDTAAKNAAVERAKRAPVEKDRRSEILEREIAEQRRKLNFERDLSQASPEKRQIMLAEESKRSHDLAAKGRLDLGHQSMSGGDLGQIGAREIASRKAIEEMEANLAASYAKGTNDTSLGDALIAFDPTPLGKGVGAAVNYFKNKENKGINDARASASSVITGAGEDLIEGASSKYEIMSRSGSETLRAQAELDKINAARSYKEAKLRGVPGGAGSGAAHRQKRLDMRMGKAVGGDYTKLDDDELMRMQDRAKSRLEVAQKNVSDIGANTDQAFATKNQKADEAREEKIASLRVDTEVKISKLKELGYALADKEHKLKMRQLDREIAQEESAPNRDQKKIDLLYAQRNTASASHGASMVARAQMGIGVGMDLASQDAQIRGDSKRGQEIQDFGVGKDRYDSLIAQGVDPRQARAAARQFASNAISLSAMNQGGSFNSSIASDSITRIGGGGNVAYGENNPMLTVAQRNQKTLESIDKYITLLYKERSKGEIAK